tara:strand:- start:8249 stop:8992 length:744 start_codon:yes stop_codon:yes gene_type:complete
MIDDDLLPELIAPPPQPEEPNLSLQIKDPDFPSDNESEEEIQDESRIKPKVQFLEEELVEEDIAPEPKKRTIIPREEIFNTAPQVEKVKKEKKPRKKVQISDERREQLREQMKKAQAAKKIKAQERKELKDLEDKVKKKETEDKKKRLRKKLASSVDDDVDEETGESNPNFDYKPPPKTPRNSPNKKVVEDTIQQAVAKGIEAFEVKRKAAKKEKKERIEKEERDKQVFRTVSKAVDPDKFWENCFT